MKRTIQIAIALIFVSGFAFATENRANGENETTLISQKDAVVSVTYQSEEVISLLIEILDENDEIVHHEKVKTKKGKKGITKTYDLNTYGSGKYTFKVNDGNGNIERIVKIKSNSNLALFRLNDSKRVKLILADPNETVIVEMYDQSGNLIQRDYIDSGEIGISRVYDLSKRRRGDTHIQVRYGKKVMKTSEF